MSTINELKQMAKNSGVKYFSLMNKASLCAAMGIPIPSKPKKPIRIVFLNNLTGDTLKFVSITSASRVLGINSGLIFYYMKNNKEMVVEGIKYKITRIS